MSHYDERRRNSGIVRPNCGFAVSTSYNSTAESCLKGGCKWENIQHANAQLTASPRCADHQDKGKKTAHPPLCLLAAFRHKSRTGYVQMLYHPDVLIIGTPLECSLKFHNETRKPSEDIFCGGTLVEVAYH